MPELPEVEITCRGLQAYIAGSIITNVTVRERRLRTVIADDFADHLYGQRIVSVSRRAKYVLCHLSNGDLIAHLGMSGRMVVTPRATFTDARHMHVIIDCDNAMRVAFFDPRRFGCLLYLPRGDTFAPFTQLGVEPLDRRFNTAYLYRAAQRTSRAVKQLIMDGTVVVGVGNIYASEALFTAGIDPHRQGISLSLEDCRRLVRAIRQTLRRAIDAGGTTLRDFAAPNGNHGFFLVELQVYGRADEPCVLCQRQVVMTRQVGRSTFYCRHCQQ